MSKAHDTARRKGAEAFRAGIPAAECPYYDKRNALGRITGARGFRRAWYTGWLEAEKEKRAQVGVP